MDNSKPFFLSKRFWGIFLAVLGHFGLINLLCAKVGLPIPTDYNLLASQIVGGIGDLLALYGAVVANGPLTLLPAPTAPLQFIADPLGAGKVPTDAAQAVRNSQSGSAALVLIEGICLAAFIIGVLVMSGCAVTPKTPKQSLYLVEGELNAALEAGNAYKALPACGSGAPVLCSQPAVVAKVQAAGKCAVTLFFAARNAVVPESEAPHMAVQAASCADASLAALVDAGSGVDLGKLIDAVKQSAAALTSLTDNLKTQ